MRNMRRGEVWRVDFDPARGGKIRKIRPAVIVSNDLSNINRLQIGAADVEYRAALPQ